MSKPVKIIKLGDGAAIPLSPEMLDKLRVGLGDELFLSERPDGYSLHGHDPDIAEAMAVAERIMVEDRDILAVLAK